MNKDLYTNALSAFDEASIQIRYYIEAIVEELGGDVDLERLPLVYTTYGGEIHITYANRVFGINEADNSITYKVSCFYIDEEGKENEGLEYLYDLSVNELYSIMDTLHTKMIVIENQP